MRAVRLVGHLCVLALAGGFAATVSSPAAAQTALKMNISLAQNSSSCVAVDTPDHQRGLKMRTMENPLHIQAYRQFGILPTAMAFTEVFTALQQGTVDAQENPLSVITSAKLDQVQKYLTLTGHVYSPAVIFMY